MRDANGRLQWADGRNVGAKTVSYMLDENMIVSLDADLFGDPERGQTIGVRQ